MSDKPTITFTVMVQEGTNQYEETLSFDLHQLITAPNPRQAVMSHIKYLTNTALADANIKFSI